MKRFLPLLLIASILCTALSPTAVFAEGQSMKTEFISPTYERNSGPSYEALDAYVDDMTALRAALNAVFSECAEQINLYEYKIPSTLINELAFYIWKDIPEAFHVLGLGYLPSSGFIHTLYLEYDLNKNDYGKMLKQCQDVAAKMTEGLDDPRLSEVDKALILHDRLAVHNEYDTSYNAPYTHEMVGALVNRTSVCEGYAMAYSYLLDQVGIRNYYCQSEKISHGWNIVYIDGVKYHVDVTWDDPLNDRRGRVYHHNFLRSTAAMLEIGHHKDGAYDFDSTPHDTRYDEAYWQNSETAFQVLDGKLYYIDSSESSVTLKRVDPNGHKVLADVSDSWRTSQGNWGGWYQLLSSDGKDLLYSGGDKIYRYCLDSGNTEVIWSPALPSGTAIFGFAYEDGDLLCVYDDSPNFNVDTNHTNLIKQSYAPHIHAHNHIYDDACDAVCDECRETRIPPHVYDGASDLICNLCGHERPSYISGDVDGSGKVDLNDAIHLLYHINFSEAYKVNQPVDFDGSGTLELNDAIYLLYHVNFSAQYPLH